MAIKRCCAPGCRSIRSRNEKKTTANNSFFRFPESQSPRSALWLAFVNKEADWKPNSYSLLCADHFPVDCFTNTGRNYLKPTAVPTIPSSLVHSSLLPLTTKCLTDKAVHRLGLLPESPADDLGYLSEESRAILQDILQDNAAKSDADLPMTDTVATESEQLRVVFTFDMLWSNVGLVRLPQTWNYLHVENCLVFIKIDPTTFETLYTIGISSDFSVKIRVGSRAYSGWDFGRDTLVTFQAVSDLVFAVESANRCRYAESDRSDGCELIYRSGKSACTPCKQLRRRHTSESCLDSIRVKCASLSNERKCTSVKLLRRQRKIAKQQEEIEKLKRLARSGEEEVSRKRKKENRNGGGREASLSDTPP